MKKTRCEKCKSKVLWKRLEGRWQCFDLDGSVHWDNCSKRRWEQTKATGEHFKTENSSGYKDSIHGTRYEWIKADFVTFPDKPIVDCPHCVPPWEVCPNGCPNAL